jgi:hypothetical protein
MPQVGGKFCHMNYEWQHTNFRMQKTFPYLNLLNILNKIKTLLQFKILTNFILNPSHFILTCHNFVHYSLHVFVLSWVSLTLEIENTI